MFICPICNKEFNTLSEYSQHINKENEEEVKKRKDAERAKVERTLNELEKKIRDGFATLRENIDSYNKLFGKTKFTAFLEQTDYRENAQRFLESIFNL